MVAYEIHFRKTSKTRLIPIEGNYGVKFQASGMSQGEREFVKEKGFFVMKSCDKISNFASNAWGVIKMFAGGQGMIPWVPIFGSKIRDYQLKANIDFVKQFAGFEWKMRRDPKLVLLDKKSVKSGDLILIYRFDGIDNIIHWGTGSRAGHTAVALWDKDELYVLESQEALYWPTKNIQRRKWSSWIKYADNADYNVVLVPIKTELSARMSEDKAWKAFKELENQQYGFSNFVFGWLDTEHNNLPDLADLNLLTIVLGLIEKVAPKVPKLMFYDAWNHRLGTKDLTMSGIWEELYKRQMTIEQLSAIPEKDDSAYPSGRNYVCSSFVTHIYQAAGLFGDMEINATEFTPKDLYELNFFDVSGARVPAECKDFAPHGYCQLMGKVDMDVGKIGWVKPYPHMNEKCPSMAPNFERTEGC